MTCKGVYASLGFSIYITKDEMEIFIRTGRMKGSAYIGKTRIGDGGLFIGVNEEVVLALQRAYAEDAEAIRQAKSSMRSGFFGRKRTKH